MKDNITDFLHESVGCVNRLSDDWKDISFIITLIRGLKDTGGTVYVAGNGGSASTASHFVCDLNKKAGMKAICLNDNIPLITAITNDYGWNYVYEEQLKMLGAKGGDMLIVFSTRGGIDETRIHSRNLIRAVEYMNKLDTFTLGISGADGGFFNICGFNLIVKSESIPVIESVHSLICHLIAWEI